jgi:uncharacterized membrane protein
MPERPRSTGAAFLLFGFWKPLAVILIAIAIQSLLFAVPRIVSSIGYG